MSRHGRSGGAAGIADGTEAVLPTAAQREIWLAEQRSAEGNAAYRIGEYIDIRGAVDPEVFDAAVRQMIGEADALRVRLVDNGDGPVQIVGPVPERPLPFLDFSAAPDPRAAAHAWVDRDLARPLDLARGPLFSYALIKLGAERYWWYHSYHHIAIDGFGFNLVTRRVAEVYSALVAGDVPPPSPFGRLRDLVQEDLAYRSSPEYAEDRAYWTGVLAGRRSANPLSSVCASAEVDAERRTVRRTVARPLCAPEGLAEAARRFGVPRSRLIIAAVALYTHRLTGARDLVVGLAVTGRAGRVARSVPGMMSNVLPLRLEVRHDTRLDALVAQVDSRVGAALRHQRYRGEELHRELALPGDFGTAFSPGVNFMGFAQDMTFAGLGCSAHNVSIGPITDLSVAVWDRRDAQGPTIVLHADPSVYGDVELDRHQGRLVRLLDSFADTPADRHVGTIDLLFPDERSLAEQAGPASHRDCSVDADARESSDRAADTFPALFEDRVRATPDAPALVAVAGDGRQVTLGYRELDERANRIARMLAARGAGPERIVGLALPRGADLVAAILGVLKSGAAYVPLDPDYPAARLTGLVADTAPVLVVTTAEVAAVHGFAVPAVVLDEPDTRAELAAHPGDAPERTALLARHTAYVVHTSGSTGQAKGVAVTHAALANLVTGHSAAMFASADRLGRPLRVALTTSVAFDASWDQLAALAHGHTLLVAERDTWADPKAVAAWVVRDRIDFLNAPPAWMAELLDHGVFDPACGWSPAVAVVGGDAVPGRLWERLRALEATAVWNCYGPTECTVDAAAARLDAAPSGARPLIGGAVPGAR
ncbi:MAG TPA: AMP-binding protein, partial [Yinghuangia sp.]|nr:AMP-binding protein [Yinghuangia sp.]